MTGAQTSKPLVLIVDDDEDTRQMYAQALEDAGYIVDVAGDGEQAVSSACAGRPRLIVMDLSMPGIDGFIALRALRALRELDSIYIIVLSGFTDEGSRAKATAAGCNEFLSKPMLPSTLVDRVRLALAA